MYLFMIDIFLIVLAAVAVYIAMELARDLYGEIRYRLAGRKERNKRAELLVDGGSVWK